MPIKIVKDGDYMISTVQDLPSDGRLTRTFNFASETLTTLYERVYRYGEAVDLASQLQTRNFSELDSQAEVEIMRKELQKQGGTPPESSQGAVKGRIRAASSQP